MNSRVRSIMRPPLVLSACPLVLSACPPAFPLLSQRASTLITLTRSFRPPALTLTLFLSGSATFPPLPLSHPPSLPLSLRPVLLPFHFLLHSGRVPMPSARPVRPSLLLDDCKTTLTYLVGCPSDHRPPPPMPFAQFSLRPFPFPPPPPPSSCSKLPTRTPSAVTSPSSNLTSPVPRVFLLLFSFSHFKFAINLARHSPM